VHLATRRLCLGLRALGGVLAAGAAPLFLGLKGIAALGDEGPREALQLVSLLLLLRFGLLPFAHSSLRPPEPSRVALNVCGSPVLQHLRYLLELVLSMMNGSSSPFMNGSALGLRTGT
jgi:hypothetical protein